MLTALVAVFGYRTLLLINFVYMREQYIEWTGPMVVHQLMNYLLPSASDKGFPVLQI